MVDAQTANEVLYCSQQIKVPLNLPYILKQYAKAAIRTQPADLLFWSAMYFRALANGKTPPVKERIEYPPITTPSGLTPGFLKVLINQFGNKKGIVTEKDIAEQWMGIGLKMEALQEILKLVGVRRDKIQWLNFVSVSAGYLCPSLTQTMILVCELLTNDAEGGPATIDIEIFLALFKFLGRLNCGVVTSDENDELQTLHYRGSVATESYAIPISAAAKPTYSISYTTDSQKDEVASSNNYRSEKVDTISMDPEAKDSEAGLMVWEDVEPPFRRKFKSPQPSQEGLLSDQGLATFENIEQVPTTPGYIESDELKVETEKKIEMEVKIDEDEIEMEITHLGESTEELLLLNKKEKVEEVQEEKDSIEDEENSKKIEQETITKESADYAKEKDESEMKKASEDVDETDGLAVGDKTLEEKTEAEPENRSTSSKTGKKTGKKKKKDFNEAGEMEEIEGGAEEDQQVEDDREDEFINEEDYVESSSSESITLDINLLAKPAVTELEDDEEWVEEEIDEEVDEEDENGEMIKVKKKIKKLIKRKKALASETSESIESETEMEVGHIEEKETDKTSKGSSESVVDKIKGKEKKDVDAPSFFNIFPTEDIDSISSEPENFENSFIHIPGIGPKVPESQILAVVRYMKQCAGKQNGYVMPRNIRHFLCPPLDIIQNEDKSEE
ncbi:uncharacterized protein LOC142333468 isoform X2 [Lycorma delicatula]|uniref:uncharacterized protein LOC142333468 isoform X2 n=1 Tax=Lycorma delicatula TaxID=130591 RepID=UPI003F5168D1